MTETSADGGYRYVETGAQLYVHAWASTAAGALAQVAAAVLALAVVPDDVVAAEHREVRAQAGTEEALVVSWINECLYVHEIEGFAVRRVEVNACESCLVHGLLHGEELDPARHRAGPGVKAASISGLRIQRSADRYEVVVAVER